MNIPIVGLVGLIALVVKIVDFVRLLANASTEKSAIVTQALAWLGGVLAVVLYAATDFADSVTIGGHRLDQTSIVSCVLIGMVLGSMASAAVDAKQAIDNNDSAAKPPLLKD